MNIIRTTGISSVKGCLRQREAEPAKMDDPGENLDLLL